MTIHQLLNLIEMTFKLKLNLSHLTLLNDLPGLPIPDLWGGSLPPDVRGLEGPWSSTLDEPASVH